MTSAFTNHINYTYQFSLDELGASMLNNQRQRQQ
jgi:hypothetical protein